VKLKIFKNVKPLYLSLVVCAISLVGVGSSYELYQNSKNKFEQNRCGVIKKLVESDLMIVDYHLKSAREVLYMSSNAKRNNILTFLYHSEKVKYYVDEINDLKNVYGDCGCKRFTENYDSIDSLMIEEKEIKKNELKI